MKTSLLILLACSALSVAHAAKYRFATFGGPNNSLVAEDVTTTTTPFLFGGAVGGNLSSFAIGSGLSLDAGVLSANGGDWDSITGTPTTLAGYGISDAITAALAASTYQPIIGTGTLALSKLATDPLARANHTGTQAWSTITGTPTTLAGYGISDAITSSAADAAYQPKTSNLTTLGAGFGGLFSGVVFWDHTTQTFTRSFPIPNSALPGIGAGSAGGSFGVGSLTVSLGDAILASSFRTAVLPSKTGNAGKVLAVKGDATDYELITPASGITINTTTTSGASAGDFLTSNGTTVQKLTPGAGVNAAIVNATDASGGLLSYGIIGTSGAKVPLLNASNTFGANGAASTPAISATGTIFSGGTSTTTKPYWLIEPAGTTSNGWGTAGTLFGLNAPSSFVGELFNIQLNGALRLKLDYSGFLNIPVGYGSGSAVAYANNYVAYGAFVSAYDQSCKLVLGSVNYLVSSGGQLSLGLPSATPAAQRISGQEGSGTNITGGDLNLVTRGTGTGTSGAVNIQTHAAGSSGSTLGTPVTRLSVKPSGIINLSNVPTSSAGLSSGDLYQTAGALMIVP